MHLLEVFETTRQSLQFTYFWGGRRPRFGLMDGTVTRQQHGIRAVVLGSGEGTLAKSFQNSRVEDTDPMA